MAKSKYEYVKEFEEDDKLLRNVYILVRIDGKGFHKYRSHATRFISGTHGHPSQTRLCTNS